MVTRLVARVLAANRVPLVIWWRTWMDDRAVRAEQAATDDVLVHLGPAVVHVNRTGDSVPFDLARFAVEANEARVLHQHRAVDYVAGAVAVWEGGFSSLADDD